MYATVPTVLPGLVSCSSGTSVVAEETPAPAASETDLGGAVCFATQNLEEIEHANRTIVLQDGQVASLSVEEVFR